MSLGPVYLWARSGGRPAATGQDGCAVSRACDWAGVRAGSGGGDGAELLLRLPPGGGRAAVAAVRACGRRGAAVGRDDGQGGLRVPPAARGTGAAAAGTGARDSGDGGTWQDRRGT